MSLTIYFLRHGETSSSRTGSYCGELDQELTEIGSQMAAAFAKAYSALEWQAVFVSPKKRTIATAKPFCQATGMEMQIREGLKEMNFGEWEGKSAETVKQEYSQAYFNWSIEPAWNAPPGGETAVQVAARAALVIAEIEQKYRQGNVLVVAHKTTIRVVICSLLGMDLGRYRDRIDMPVAAVSAIEFGKRGPLLKFLGDRHHLGDLKYQPGT